MAKKSWFKYTDECGRSWRIQTTQELAQMGGLAPTDEQSFPPLPKSIEARYVWLQEDPRPADRQKKRIKIILEKDYLKERWPHNLSWLLNDKKMIFASYYGEVTIADD